jgi:hypothetical protein
MLCCTAFGSRGSSTHFANRSPNRSYRSICASNNTPPSKVNKVLDMLNAAPAERRR